MKKILIWGTGSIAGKVIKNGLNGDVTGFIETKKTKDFFRGKKVYGIDEIPADYEYMIIANSFVDEIYHICTEKELDFDKIIFLRGIKKRKGIQELQTIKEILGEKNYINYCMEFNLKKYTFWEEDAQRYQCLNVRDSFKIDPQYVWPVITDKYALAGTIGNYFWQDLWAAKLIYKSGVKEHFDIGSRIDGFIAHLLAMDIKVTLIDIREFPEEIENLYTIIDDATKLEQVQDESIESMSALCSLEHFGLGRYGDPIDPEACFKCFAEIQKKIKKGGHLYLSVPVGKERVEFNAHRVFCASTVIENFSSMELKEFSCTANGKIEYGVAVNAYDQDSHHGDYRYGLFHFVKPGAFADGELK